MSYTFQSGTEQWFGDRQTLCDKLKKMVQYDCIEKPLSRIFYNYGRFIARHPLWFLIIPLLVAGALASGLYNFHAEYDVEQLFTPEKARSKDERHTIQQLFPEGDDS